MISPIEAAQIIPAVPDGATKLEAYIDRHIREKAIESKIGISLQQFTEESGIGTNKHNALLRYCAPRYAAAGWWVHTKPDTSGAWADIYLYYSRPNHWWLRKRRSNWYGPQA